ncbi:MAG: hypothetical protein AUJ48_03845 [Deltaproteobacteria bacterium CG1_02_45_11]|nr:MAG: hypothetical protein AUJ48_03845 [Deltaproteobacteria bacterium CG1_02_45_11]
MNKRVILVNPSPDYDKEEYKHYDISMGVGAPLGILLLATILKNNGYETRIIDGQTCDYEEETLREIAGKNVLCAGISVMSSQYRNAIELSGKIKQAREMLPVVWGGFHPTIVTEKTLQNPCVDYIMQGEADKGFLQFCNFLSKGGDIEKVENLGYKKDGKVTLNACAPLSTFDELPVVDRELIGDVEKHVLKRNALGEETRFMNVLSGLGCNYICAFCHNAILHKKHRTRKAPEIIEEMNYLHEKYSISEFAFQDENFFGNRERIFEMLKLLRSNRHKFRWSTSLRADYVKENYINRELLREVREAGGYYLGLGAESGSQFILDKKIRKGIKVQDVLNLAEWAKGLDITLNFSFIAGIPGETCDMTYETLQLIEKIKKINPKTLIIGPHVFRPYPGSPLYQEALKMGLKEPDDWNGGEGKKFLESLSHFTHIDASAIPWHPQPVRFKYMMLSYYLFHLKKRKKFLENAVIGVLKAIAAIRLKFKWYSFWFEKPLLDMWNSKLS